jgi:hypothetical protein
MLTQETRNQVQQKEVKKKARGTRRFFDDSDSEEELAAKVRRGDVSREEGTTLKKS